MTGGTSRAAPLGMDDRGKMLKRAQLVLPVARLSVVQRRLPLPAEGERPNLYVITTPPEVRARWLRWVAIRQSMMLTVLITFALIAAMAVI